MESVKASIKGQEKRFSRAWLKAVTGEKINPFYVYIPLSPDFKKSDHNAPLSFHVFPNFVLFLHILIHSY